MSQTNFKYIDEDYVALILRFAANEQSVPCVKEGTWAFMASGSLIKESVKFDLLRYNDLSYFDVSFIKTPYQWLYIYHQLVYACKKIQELPEQVDASTWELFSAGLWSEHTKTNGLKAAAKLMLLEFKKLATFENLEPDWFTLMQAVYRNGYSVTIDHGTAEGVRYDTKKNVLIDNNGQEVFWYDILYANISSEASQSIMPLLSNSCLSFSVYNNNTSICSLSEENL